MRNSKTRPMLYILSLSSGHLFVDFTQGSLAAMLPFLIEKNHFDYASAATLIFAMNLVSSIIQPLFGYLSDKRQNLWLLPVSLLLTGASFSLLGWIDQYYGLILAVIICGIGVAAYHPDAARLTNELSFFKKGRGMSLFSFGGNIGFAIGPIVLTVILTLAGLRGTSYILLPTFFIISLFVIQLSKIKALLAHDKPTDNDAQIKTAKNQQENNWKAFGILSLALFSRSIIFYGLNTFLSLYFIHVLGQSKTMGSLALGLLFIVGSLGTLLGGNLADRLGFIKVLRLSFTILPIVLLLFPLIKNPILAILFLIPMGLIVFMPYSSMVLLGQSYLPKNMGLASGVTLGLAVSIGGIASPILGSLADAQGLSIVLYTLTIVALVPLVASYLLKK